MTKAFKLVSARAINGMVSAAVESAANTTVLVHEAATQSCAHIEAHGDWTLLKRLMLGLKASGFRFQGVRIWIESHTPIRFPADKAEPGGFTIKILREGQDGYTPWNIKGMWETPFTAFEPSKERVGAAKTPESLAKAFSRLLDNTGPDGKPIDTTKPYFEGDATAYVRELQTVIASRLRAKAEPDMGGERVGEAA